MPGRIHFICLSKHEGDDCGRDGPTITLVEKQWACCPYAGYEHHDWQPLPGDGLALEEISARALTHRPPLEP